MARPKKGMKGYEEANRKWKETMLARYGGAKGLHKKMQEIGAKGGANGKGPDFKGGFASSHELAVSAGRKGGRISSRKGVPNGCGKIHQKEA